jgi:hypothetical protein
MELIAIVTEDVHALAIKRARAVGREVPLPAYVLNAPLDDDTKTWLERIWDVVEDALQKAYHDGMDAARPLIEKASQLVSELTVTITRRAGEVRAAIQERLSTYLQNVVDGALQRVRSNISVGGIDLKVNTVTIEQRVKISGSIKASLDELCEFVADGEISLSAEYSVDAK